MSWKEQLKRQSPTLTQWVRKARRSTQTVGEIREWMGRSFQAPAPWVVKRAVVRRNAIEGGVFVETGTYMGDTAAYAAQFSKRVITLEPFGKLYEEAKLRFARSPSVEVINAPSEEAFPQILPALSGDVTFWLDAHYSGEGTFIGQHISPIELELESIRPHLPRLSRCVVMVDDMRGFGLSPGYPLPEVMVQWAIANEMKWHIEHDILVLEKR
jgi:hypothetical protein